MAMNGFFAGGMAEGMKNAADLDIRQQAETRQLGYGTRALDLQQQGQQNQVQQLAMARADKQIADTLGIISETSQAAIDSGVNPKVIAAKMQPLVDSAKSLAMASGRDPASIDAQVQTLVSRQPSPKTLVDPGGENALGEKPGKKIFNPRTGVMSSPTVAPAPVAPGQSINLTGPGTTVTGVDVQPVGPQMAQATPAPTVPAQPGEPAPRNEDFLKSLPPAAQTLIKQIADYEVKPTDLSIKGGHREKLLGLAKLYDPEFDSLAAPARQKAINEFAAGGPSSPAGQITAGNTAILHANEMGRSAEELKALPGILSKLANAGVPFTSYVAAQLKNKSVEGTPEGKALAEFMVSKQHFAEEVTKFYSGSQGAEAERERALKNLDEAKSLTELRGAINREAVLMADKISAMQDRIKNAMGPRGWLSAIKRTGGDYPIIQSQAQRALAEIKMRNGGDSHSAAPAAPAGANGGVVDYRTYFGGQ